jgi:hypothetical protein
MDEAELVTQASGAGTDSNLSIKPPARLDLFSRDGRHITTLRGLERIGTRSGAAWKQSSVGDTKKLCEIALSYSGVRPSPVTRGSQGDSGCLGVEWIGRGLVRAKTLVVRGFGLWCRDGGSNPDDPKVGEF